ncbi:hypothetical protein ABGB14_44875 [Nonomuraea sp. B10E15]
MACIVAGAGMMLAPSLGARPARSDGHDRQIGSGVACAKLT